jgi:hypothetical protein
MKILFLTIAVMMSPLALADPPANIGDWKQSHPAAAESLATWVRANRESAGPIFRWARAHSVRAQLFVKWFVDHPNQGLDEFIASHSDWPAVELVMRPNHAAMESLIVWEHGHPAAANDLAAATWGLPVVGFHLFRELWDSKTSR